MSEIAFELAGLPPTPNSRRHWAQVYRDNDEWKRAAWLAATEAIRSHDRGVGRTRAHLALPLPAPTITVTFYLPDHRRRDMDNLVASIKPCLDGVVAAKLVADDSIGQVEVIHRHEYRKGRPGTRIAVRSNT